MRKAILLFTAILAITFSAARADDTATQAEDTSPEIQGTLTSALSSATAQVGDPVLVSNLQCTGLDAVGFPGASCTGGRLSGHVTKAQKATQGVHAQLEVQFDSLDIKTSQGPKNLVALFQIEQLGPNKNTGRQVTGALVGAAAGAVLGKFLGHSTAAIIAGSAAGAAGGFLLENNNRQDIEVAQDQAVKVLLKSISRVQSR
jgi:hypothetical protein